MLKVLFFAQLAEQAGCAALEVDHCAGLTARSLIDRLESKVDAAAIETLRHDAVLLSVNQKLADWDDMLNDGDEIGLLPPFSGG